jgi:TRAP-type C4-dicarboxylate transport system substrate-binding protein
MRDGLRVRAMIENSMHRPCTTWDLLREQSLRAFAGLLVLAFGTSCVDAQPIILKFSHFLGPRSFFQLDVAEPWAKELEAKTSGKVKIEIHDGTSLLGKVGEQASNVATGAADIALGLRGAEGDRFPVSSTIELPFLVPNAAVGSRALWTLYREGQLADEYRDYKVLALFVHNAAVIASRLPGGRLSGRAARGSTA